ncbi:MAG TPA: hypothetical protein VJO12_05650 [Stellaceae bacterium]|nr:hypothetical protein [Stellaceae bacterium]
MKPTELPRHLWPACRRVMLRHAAAMARDLLDHADDLRLRVRRARIEHIERSALGELAAAGDTIADAAADMRRLPPEMAGVLHERAALAAQLRQMFRIMRTQSAQGNSRPLVEGAWESLAEQLVAFIASAPPP